MMPAANRPTGDPTGSWGFTLIEILVTISIFALVLSSLTVALRSGVVTWRSVRDHQTRRADASAAIEQFGIDFGALTIVSNDKPAIAESTTGPTGEDLTLTLLGTTPIWAAAPDFEWASVRYYVKELAQSTDTALVRSLTPMSGKFAIVGGEGELELLRGVRSIRFDYVTSQETLPEWQDKEKLPIAIKVRIEFESGAILDRELPVVSALLQAGAES